MLVLVFIAVARNLDNPGHQGPELMFGSCFIEAASAS